MHRNLGAFRGICGNYNLSDWAGGVRRFAREEGQLSRSEFKLLEAFEVFDISVPEKGLALDLGAAPGGWTRILRTKGLRVVAVDPAKLDGHLSRDPGVQHVQTVAQRYLPTHVGRDAFDLIVNDMRIDVDRSVRLMCQAASFLKRSRFAIMTLKLKPRYQRKQIRDALAILAHAYTVWGTRKLFHNRNEVTVALRRD